MTPDIRTIAREALKAEHRRLSHDPGSPPLPNALADAVALAVCNEIRERMGNRADRLKNEEFHAVWRELSLLDEQIAAFQPETATPQPARKEDPFRAEYGYPQPAVSSVPVGEQDDKEQDLSRSDHPRVNREADLRGEARRRIIQAGYNVWEDQSAGVEDVHLAAARAALLLAKERIAADDFFTLPEPHRLFANAAAEYAFAHLDLLLSELSDPQEPT